MLTLRPYQQQVIGGIYNSIRSRQRRILLFSPTGSGKTIVAGKLTTDAVSRGRRLFFIVHREILINQTYNKFQEFGLECGFIKADYEENRDAPVQIASVQTLPRRDWWRQAQADVVLLDEAHLTAFSSIVGEMMSQVWKDAIYIGLTATPWRLASTQGMGDVFDEMVSAPMPY